MLKRENGNRKAETGWGGGVGWGVLAWFQWFLGDFLRGFSFFPGFLRRFSVVV